MEALAKELTGSPIGYAPGDQATGASMHNGACSMGASVAAAVAVAVVMAAAAAAAGEFTEVDRCDGFGTTTAPAPASTSGGPAQRCTAHERDSSVAKERQCGDDARACSALEGLEGGGRGG